MKKWRTYNLTIHRDFGYFISSLTIVYCISGLALNHVDDWDPDFIIYKQEVKVAPRSADSYVLSKEDVAALDAMVGEDRHKTYDYPTADQVKVYYNDGSLHLNLATGMGRYESLRRRPIFYESNVLHRNSATGWRWAADVFAILLIIVNVTGLFVLRGRYGLTGRGKWLVAAGALGPLTALVMYSFGL